MSLWTEYRTWFGGIQLQEVSGGDFVIISDDLYDEFKKKVYSYVDRAFSIVKAVELIDVWLHHGWGNSEATAFIGKRILSNVFSTA